MLEFANFVNRTTHNLEIMANAGGAIPIGGVFVSSARSAAAVNYQIPAGLAFMAFGTVAAAYGAITNDHKLTDRSIKFIDFGLRYTFHGLLNAARGIAEIKAQLCTFFTGPLIFNLVIAKRSNEWFQPIVKYRMYGKGYEYCVGCHFENSVSRFVNETIRVPRLNRSKPTPISMGMV